MKGTRKGSQRISEEKVLAAKINTRHFWPNAQDRLKEQMELELLQSKHCLASYLYREGSRQAGSYCSKGCPVEGEDYYWFWVQCLVPCLKSPGLDPLSSRPRGIRTCVRAILGGSRSNKDREFHRDGGIACAFDKQYLRVTG